MRPTRLIATVLASAGAVAMLYGIAYPMPMFARRFDMECSGCHTVVPKLNADGLMFRAAGFRMGAESIGKAEEGVNDISGHTSTRLQARFDQTRTRDVENTNPLKRRTDQTRFSFYEITFYPLSGAFAKRFGSLFELSIGPEEPIEIENAYLRGAWLTGGEAFVSARLGVFHPFEGYGASDRPVTISRPLFQITQARLNQKTFFTPWNFDEAGLELGYTHGRTSLRGTIFDGLVYDPNEDAAHPVQTITAGNAFAKDPARPDYHRTDIQLFATQVLNDDGAGISAYYYTGGLALPVDNDPLNGYFENKFYRVAGYASYPIVKRVNLLGGVQQGKDDQYTSVGGYGDRFTSLGYFGEADAAMGKDYSLAARYDWFDPSRDVAATTADENNQVRAYTLGLNKSFENGLQFIAQYQYKETEQGTRATKLDNQFQTRLIWIW